MMNYRKILVPLDGSVAAEKALPAVETLAKALNASVCVMRAYYAHVFPGIEPSLAQKTAMRAAEMYVQKIEKQLGDAGIEVDTHTLYEGDPATAILETCTRNKIDLIVMSSHGHGLVGHWLLGSVAEKVIHHASAAVFLVRADS
jgi:nucleotide-binding universal stress UspA family protein